MDRDKNNNPLSQPPATDTGSSQVPDTSSLAPSADTPIISSAGLPTATPLNAPLPTDPLHPTHTSASGSGDIELGKIATNKRKPLIIGAIILAIVALFGIIAVVVSPSSKNEIRGGTPEALFNRYANYLLFNEEKSEAPSGEFDLDTTYEVDRQLSRENMDEPY